MRFRMRASMSFAGNPTPQRGIRLRSWVLRTLFWLAGLLLLFMFVAPSVHPTQAVSSKLRRYPCLTDVVGSYATLNWATDSSSKVGTVTWGKAGSESCTAHTAS